jgi:predicted RNase H-like nuclease (RuvC/YqgF family)
MSDGWKAYRCDDCGKSIAWNGICSTCAALAWSPRLGRVPHSTARITAESIAERVSNAQTEANAKLCAEVERLQAEVERLRTEVERLRGDCERAINAYEDEHREATRLRERVTHLELRP